MSGGDPRRRLDDASGLAVGDPGGMLARVESAADQWRNARAAAAAFQAPAGWRDLHRVVVAGMGGSAIAADLLGTWLARRWRIPLHVVRDYRLPGWVDHRTLVVACSYSGGTEETLAVWEQAGEQGLERAAVTTGGELGRLAQAAGVPLLALEPGYQPRAALPMAFASLAALLAGVGPAGEGPAHEGARRELEDVPDVLEGAREVCGRGVPVGRNPAKDLALWLDTGLPILYAPAHPLGAVAVRWRGQLSENGKRLTGGHLLPELDHNEIVGWEAQPDLYPRTRVLFLEDPEQGERLTRRVAVTARLVAEAGAPVRRLSGQGDHLLARTWSLLALADYTSVYLALGWGIDPTPVNRIDRLKSELREAAP